jgi:hypothetical protein
MTLKIKGCRFPFEPQWIFVSWNCCPIPNARITALRLRYGIDKAACNQKLASIFVVIHIGIHTISGGRDEIGAHLPPVRATCIVPSNDEVPSSRCV